METSIRQRFLAAVRRLGPENYNKLIRSVDEVRSRGRLRSWQERLLAQLPEELRDLIAGPSDFITAFADAELAECSPLVITKEQFRENPIQWYYSGRVDIPDAWIAVAWEETPDFRDSVTYEYVREASKNGSLQCLQSSLEVLTRALPNDRLVEIYERVRQQSPHRESEFRQTFERLLGSRIAAFPPPLFTT